MTRADLETPRECPFCAESHAPTTKTCRLCGGARLVTRAIWEKYKDRPPEKSTSTTIDMHRVALGRIAELENALGDKGEEITARGRALLAVIESWKQAPADGKQRTDHYQKVVDWLRESADAMRGIRRFK